MMSSQEGDVSLVLTSMASLISSQKVIEDSKRPRPAEEGTHLTGSDRECNNQPKKLRPCSTSLSESSDSTLE